MLPIRTHRDARALFAVLALVVAAGCASTSGEPAAQQRRLVEAVAAPARDAAPEYLSESTRVALHTRMASHARDMGELTSAIMILDYGRIETTAHALAYDVGVVPPESGAATPHEVTPRKLLELEEDLRKQALVLYRAAQFTSALDVADAYGELSKTCVRCHAVYRAGR